MGEPKRISYVEEDPARRYGAELDGALTLEELRKVLDGWKTLAPDARKLARQLTPAEFADWRRGLAEERAGRFAGERWAQRYTVLLMPARMWRTSMTAMGYHVPWGTAWIRLKELGELDK